MDTTIHYWLACWIRPKIVTGFTNFYLNRSCRFLRTLERASIIEAKEDLVLAWLVELVDVADLYVTPTAPQLRSCENVPFGVNSSPPVEAIVYSSRSATENPESDDTFEESAENPSPGV